MTTEAITKAHYIVDTLDEKKGEDILLLDIGEVCSFTDFFVICSAPSERTLRALSDEVKLKMKEQYASLPLNTEGEPSDGWLLADYGDVVLHLFSPDTREYYDLEGLWADGAVLLHLR
jgi:ribosome-associated protein